MNAILENPAVEWIKVILRGIGQVMFQGHALTGLLFLLGIAFASPRMGFGCLAGAVVGTAVAHFLKYDPAEVKDGIYGFNACLVGIAVFFFLKPSILAVVLLVLGTAASSVVTMLMRRFLKFPTYTTPFIVTTWVLVGIANLAGAARVIPLPVPKYLSLFDALSDGLSEVFLQANPVTGLFFLAGLAVSNWRHAALGAVGSVLGTLVAMYHSDFVGDISIGIYGYNAALAGIALYLWRKSLLIPLLGILVSTPLTEFFPLTGLPTLTAPFVLACWVVLGIGWIETFFTAEKAAL